MPYQHITSTQRNNLSFLLHTNTKKKDIAKLLNKGRSSIYRELKRNAAKNKVGYSTRLAKRQTKERRISANSRFKKIENDQDLKQESDPS